MATLTGNASELDDDAQEAVDEALELLEPHASHPAIAAVIGQMKGAAGEGSAGEGGSSEDEDREDEEDGEERLEKALADLQGKRARFEAHVRLEKAQKPADVEGNVRVKESLTKAERRLAHELQMKRSEGYRRSQVAKQEEERRRAAAFGERV